MRYKPAVVSGGGGAKGTVGFAGFRGRSDDGRTQLLVWNSAKIYDATGMDFFQVHALYGKATRRRYRGKAIDC